MMAKGWLAFLVVRSPPISRIAEDLDGLGRAALASRLDRYQRAVSWARTLQESQILLPEKVDMQD